MKEKNDLKSDRQIIKCLTEGLPEFFSFGIGAYFPAMARKIIELEDKIIKLEKKK